MDGLKIVMIWNLRFVVCHQCNHFIDIYVNFDKQFTILPRIIKF